MKKVEKKIEKNLNHSAKNLLKIDKISRKKINKKSRENYKIILQIFGDEKMKNFGEKIGKILRGGEIFELRGDVGAGKTTFVKGLAKGLKIADDVQSPSFTISRIYDARDDLILAHYDFYRLNDAGIMRMEIAENLENARVVLAVEWAENVENVLPREKILVKIDYLAEKNFTQNLEKFDEVSHENFAKKSEKFAEKVDEKVGEISRKNPKNFNKNSEKDLEKFSEKDFANSREITLEIPEKFAYLNEILKDFS